MAPRLKQPRTRTHHAEHNTANAEFPTSPSDRTAAHDNVRSHGGLPNPSFEAAHSPVTPGAKETQTEGTAQPGIVAEQIHGEPRSEDRRGNERAPSPSNSGEAEKEVHQKTSVSAQEGSSREGEGPGQNGVRAQENEEEDGQDEAREDAQEDVQEDVQEEAQGEVQDASFPSR